MSAVERRAVFSLAGIYSTRLLGLFLILPVFALYAQTLEDYTPRLAGLALGIYGLTQACLQLPFGIASDRFGRKPVIAAGLVLFAIGSVVAALADSMWGVLIGRALQGAGAVSAAVTALVADLTRETQRTKAMAVIGISVGASFLISIPLGSALNTIIGVPGIFWLTAVLAVASLLILWLAVPPPTASARRERSPVLKELSAVLRNGRLLQLNIGIFALHAAPTATFVVLPTALVEQAGLPANEHAALYLPLMLLSALPLFPIISLSERRHWQHGVFAGSVLVLCLAQAALALQNGSLLGIGISLLVFFMAFNVLEASLPSLVSKMAPANAKGAAIGVYSTFQFLGAFVGGDRGGWLHQHYGTSAVFAGAALLTGIWFFVSMVPRRSSA
ncbi:MAG: MFS transporter [Gammaproteobacteria bacterium]